MAWFFLGFFYAHADTWRPVNAVERRIPSELEEATLAGRVISSPEWSARGKRKTCSFILEAQRLGESGDQVSGRVRVFLYNPGTGPEPGDLVELAGNFRPMRPIDGFDYPRYLWSLGIEAVFQGAGRKSLKVLKPWPGNGIKSAVFRLRESLSSWMGMGMAQQPAALARALVLGLKGGIHPDLREDFFRTGTSHLLAISGMNIALFAGSLFLFLLALGLKREWAACGVLAAVWTQVLVSGADFPVLRAGWMASLSFGSMVVSRERKSLNVFFFALLAVLIVNTRALWNVSFQLSFLSVGALMIFLPLFSRHRLGVFWAGPFSIWLGTFPAAVCHFRIFSWVSWMANFAAIPLLHLAQLGILMGFFLGFIPLWRNLWCGFSAVFLECAVRWIRFCASMPWGHSELRRPYGWQTAVYYICMGMWIFLYGRKNPQLRKCFFMVTAIWAICALSFFRF